MFIMNVNEKKSLPKICKEKRDRQPNWTQAEKQLLLMLTKRHRAILEHKGCDGSTIKKKSDAWDEIAFNMNAAGFYRTKERLRQQLGRIKSAEAKKAKDAMAREILRNCSENTVASADGSHIQDKNIDMERKANAKDTINTHLELQRKNFTKHGDEVFIKIEKSISTDEFEAPSSESEIIQCTEKVTQFFENQKEELIKSNILSCAENQHSNMHSHLGSSDESCNSMNRRANRKIFFARSRRMHQIRIAIERERLLGLRLQRKRDKLLFQKDMEIQNLKMKVLQNLINQNKNGHINF